MTRLNPKPISRRTALKGGAAVALGLPTVAAALSACTPEQVAVTSDYASLIERVSDLSIPHTDTPGALVAGVPAYVRAVVGAFLTDAEQADFKSGLLEFDKLAQTKKATNFLSASPAQQIEILTALDTGKAMNSAQAAWRQLKDMIVFGYYTSEVATQELAYEEIPGRYIGDVPFADIGRAWLSRGV